MGRRPARARRGPAARPPAGGRRRGGGLPLAGRGTGRGAAGARRARRGRAVAGRGPRRPGARRPGRTRLLRRPLPLRGDGRRPQGRGPVAGPAAPGRAVPGGDPARRRRRRGGAPDRPRQDPSARPSPPTWPPAPARPAGLDAARVVEAVEARDSRRARGSALALPHQLDRGGAVGDVQLADDLAGVPAHRDRRDAEPGRDLAGRKPVAHQIEHLPLALGELLAAVAPQCEPAPLPAVELLDDAGDQRPGQRGLAGQHAPEGLREPARLDVLIEVAGRAGLQGGEEVRIVARDREHDHRGPRQPLRDGLGGRDAAARHVDVEQAHLGPVPDAAATAEGPSPTSAQKVKPPASSAARTPSRLTA